MYFPGRSPGLFLNYAVVYSMIFLYSVVLSDNSLFLKTEKEVGKQKKGW